MFIGSTLATLRTNLLKLLDEYNASDSANPSTSGVNSSGDVATLCLNIALQSIYSDLKNSLFLEAYGTQNLTCTGGQPYVELSSIIGGDLDLISAIKDEINNISLIEITKERYFREVPIWSKSQGTPFRFTRIGDRIYLDPSPTSNITYTVEYIKKYPDLVNDADVALLPSHFDPWILKTARVEWYIMQDITNVPSVAIIERDKARDLFMADVLSKKNNQMQSLSYFRNRYRPRVNPYDHIFALILTMTALMRFLC